MVAVLICATGELMGLTVAALGIWYAVARGRRNAGLLIAVGGVAWSMLCVYLIVPNAAGEPSMFYAMYEPVGGSPQGVLEKLVTDPGEILSAVTARNDLVYVFMLLAPVACLPLLAPALRCAASAARRERSFFARVIDRRENAPRVGHDPDSDRGDGLRCREAPGADSNGSLSSPPCHSRSERRSHSARGRA